MLKTPSLTETYTDLDEVSASTDKELSKKSERPRGMWSFLTWSFFLAQITASEGFFARSAHAEELTDGAGANADNGAAGKLAALATPAGIAQFAPEQAVAQAAPSQTDSAAAQSKAAAPSGDAGAIAAAGQGEAIDVSGGSSGGYGAQTSGSAEGDAPSETVGGEGVNLSDILPLDALPGITIDLPPVLVDLGLGSGPGVDFAVDLDVGRLPGLGADLHLGRGLDLDLALGLLPDLGVDLGLDLTNDLVMTSAVGSLFALAVNTNNEGLGVDLALGNVVDLDLDHAMPSVGVMLDVATTLPHSSLDVLTSLPEADFGVAASLAEAGVGAIAAPLGEVFEAAPIAEVLMDAAAVSIPLEYVSTGPLDMILSTTDEVTASGGSIDFAENSAVNAGPADVLFNGATYTEFNMALQSVVSAEQILPTDAAPSLPSAGDLVDIYDTALNDDAASGIQTSIGHLTLSDHIGLSH